MKLLFLLSLLFSLSVIHADIQVAEYGGCLNPNAGSDVRDFHCHFDERHCEPGEEWITPPQVVEKGYGPCTCDSDYVTPIFTHACYTSVAVFCAPEVSQCINSVFDFGPRYNSNTDIIDGCGDGSIADGSFSDLTCGKQCQCSFKYYNDDSVVEIGSTEYGACSGDNTQFTCAIYESECESDEIFYPSSSSNLSEIDCRCDDVTTGACVDGDVFAFCAVSNASCASNQTFLTRKQLADSNFSTDCRLCLNTWDQPCKDSVLPISFNGNTLSCAVIGIGNACEEFVEARSHCPLTCDACNEFICADSLAPWAFGGQTYNCGQLAALPDNRIEELCSSVEDLEGTCRGTCGTCS